MRLVMISTSLRNKVKKGFCPNAGSVPHEKLPWFVFEESMSFPQSFQHKSVWKNK